MEKSLNKINIYVSQLDFDSKIYSQDHTIFFLKGQRFVYICWGDRGSAPTFYFGNL